MVKMTKSDAQLHLSPQCYNAGNETKPSDEEQSKSIASLPLEDQREKERLVYSVQDAQEDSSHDIQTTTTITTITSVVPSKERSSKSWGSVRGERGITQLTQMGIEDEKNVAQCALDYHKPSELCKHLVRKGNGLLFHNLLACIDHQPPLFILRLSPYITLPSSYVINSL